MPGCIGTGGILASVDESWMADSVILQCSMFCSSSSNLTNPAPSEVRRSKLNPLFDRAKNKRARDHSCGSAGALAGPRQGNRGPM